MPPGKYMNPFFFLPAVNELSSFGFVWFGLVTSLRKGKLWIKTSYIQLRDWFCVTVCLLQRDWVNTLNIKSNGEVQPRSTVPEAEVYLLCSRTAVGTSCIRTRLREICVYLCHWTGCKGINLSIVWKYPTRKSHLVFKISIRNTYSISSRTLTPLPNCLIIYLTLPS